MRKLAIITGAGTGIGKATAEYFSAQSWSTVLLGRNSDRLKEVQKKLTSPSWCLQLDLQDENSIKTVATQISKIIAQEKTYIALINNAGIFENKSFSKSDLSDWLSQFKTNLFGPAELTKLLLPDITQQNCGASIVNVSSTLGLRTIANTSVYSATKAAMNSWTQSLALELAEHKIRVNAVCPGIVDTPIQSFHHLPDTDKKEMLSKLSTMQPLGRVGEPMDIAKTIFFAASEQSSWMTGALIPIDGGINLT